MCSVYISTFLPVYVCHSVHNHLSRDHDCSVIMLYFSQLGKCVQGLPSDVDCLRDVICVLVEMHAACLSRHSVQRSLARYLLFCLDM